MAEMSADHAPHHRKQPPQKPGTDSEFVRPEAIDVLTLQHTIGNQAVRRMLEDSPKASRSTGLPSLRGVIQPRVQRSTVSDAVEAAWNKRKNLHNLLRILQNDVAAKDRADPDLKKLLDKILPDPNDRWVAEQILQAELKENTTVTHKPIEVSFFEGTSSERALVIAGVHGSEQQGMQVAEILKNDLQKSKTAPFFNVILVPSLFPDNRDANKREGSTPTNRNFPKDGMSLVESGGKDANNEDILPENQALMMLMERFQPSRIISIHGTARPFRPGVFMDAQKAATKGSFKQKQLEQAAEGAASAALVLLSLAGISMLDDPKARALFKKLLVAAFLTEFTQQLADRDKKVTETDRKLVIKAAQKIVESVSKNSGATKKIGERPTTYRPKGSKRTETLEGDVKDRKLPSHKKGELSDDEKKKLKETAVVAGNHLFLGAGKENTEWPGEVDKGVSLGSYAPARGMSVFTVEPAINRTSDDYGKGKNNGDKLSEAERKLELQSYADAVRTVLLGDPDKVL